MGGAIGWEVGLQQFQDLIAANGLTDELDWSHWLPDRWGDYGCRILSLILASTAKWTTRFEHALNDKWRKFPGMKDTEKTPYLQKGWNRMPPWAKGALIGAAVGGVSMALNGRGCECN